MEATTSAGLKMSDSSTPTVATLPQSDLVVTAGVTSPSVSAMSTPSPLLAPVAAAAMPAPKTQAPSRARRLPAVDSGSLVPARRSSTRSIKRKKFDDELVESSLVKTERGRIKTSTTTATSIPITAGAQISHSLPVQGLAQPFPTASPVSNVVASISLGESGKSSLVQIPPVISTVATATAATSTTTMQTQILASKSVKEESKDSLKHMEVATTLVRPTPEKRSKPTTGKTHPASKGGSGKAVGSKSVTGRSGVSKSSSSKSGVSKSGHSKSRSKSKRSRKQKSSSMPSVKDLGRWKPHDDLALITAVQQSNDLSAVHTGVKFSCRFSLKEIEERWYALLYDSSISKIAMEAARQLHSETVANIQGKALYSNAEEKLLGTFTSSSQPSLESFQSLLQQHSDIFHPARTAKSLQCQWLLMKQYHLLPDQTVQPMPRGDHILNLSDIEDFMNDDNIPEGTEDTVEQELSLVDRRNKREIRHLEQEMPKWQVLVDSVTGISMPDFDSQTLAVLRGRLVRYLMRSREISLGRATKDNHVDVDLSLEGPAWKVSRRQGIIKLRNSGDFFLANEGKRPILVDGRPVMAGNKQKLNNNSVVEISCLRFTFLINQDVISAIRTDASKTGTSLTASAS